MLKYLPLLLVLGSCSGTRFKRLGWAPEPKPKEVIRYRTIPPELDQLARPISSDQWRCCQDLCRSQPIKVTKELSTEYIICECRSGKVFRVARIKK